MRLQWLNLALAFALELVAWLVIAFAASRLVDGMVARLVVGLVTFALVTTVWGLLASPKAWVPYAATRIATKVLVFGAATVALAGLVHPVAGVVFAVLVVVNLVTLPSDYMSLPSSVGS